MGRLHQTLGVVLCVYLLLPAVPALGTSGLQCYYSNIGYSTEDLQLVNHVCSKKQCYIATGTYNSSVSVAARGCMEADLCGKEQIQLYKGFNYTMKYACCDSYLCNSSPFVVAQALPLILAAAVAVLLAGGQL